MHKNPDTILALDPGLRELGYAVLQGRRLVTSGVRYPHIADIQCADDWQHIC